MKRSLRVCSFALVMLLAQISGVILAQETCPSIVRAALTATNDACGATGRNQACYGNIVLEAEPQPNARDFVFTTGDIVDVAEIKTLRLSSMSIADNIWGVALLRIQANLPDTLPGQNTTLLLFGDVELDNAVEQLVTFEMTAVNNANVRLRPTTDAPVLMSLQRGEPVAAIGRLADNSWVRIKLVDDQRGSGWVSSQLLRSDSDINTLAVVEASSPVFGPMQSFYFTSGVGDAPCAEAPDSGILIQTPEGAREVNLTVNGVEVTLGSTAYFQAQPGGYMTVSVVEGKVTLRAFNVQQTVPAGTVARVPLDADGVASGPPEFPQPYSEESLQALPVTILPEAVAVAPPLPESEIQVAVAEAEGVPLSGQWRVTNGPRSTECGLNVAPPASGVYAMRFSLGDGGSVLFWTQVGFPTVQFNRTAPGVYARGDVPLDYTPFGLVNIMEAYVVRVISPTRMEAEELDYIPSTDCRWTFTITWEYVGP